MKKHLIIGILLTFFSVTKAQNHFSISHFNSDNGLSQNSITAIMKDHKGYLWFGTRDGLNKFDGYNFTSITTRSENGTSIMNNRFLFIREDKNGYIWVKTYDDVVYRLNPATEVLTLLKNAEGQNITEKIKEIDILPSGNVWLETYDKGCYRVSYNEAKETIVSYFSVKNKNLINDKVEYIFEDQSKTTWILTSSGICCIDAKEKIVNLLNKQAFYTGSENSKYIILGSTGKLVVYEKRTRSFRPVSLDPDVQVSSIAAFNANNYIINTVGKGFYTMDILRNKIQHFSVASHPEMKSNDIQEIYIDRAGEAWLGIKTSEVIRYNPQTNRIVNIQSKMNVGQASNPNFIIFEDDKDVLWIQPYFGSFSWYDRANDKLIPFKSTYNEDVNILFSYGINHALYDNQGVLWISTNRGNGIFKCTFLPDYFNHFLFNESSVYNIQNETRAVMEDREKRLWVATKDGVVHVYAENRRLLGSLNSDGRIVPNGKLNILVYNFFQDKSGAIWLATKRRGLFRLKATAKNTFRLENYVHNPSDQYSPSNNDFYSVTQDKNGRIWAGSYGGGLHLIDESTGKIRFIHAKNGLSHYPLANCSKVRQVTVDSKQRIWVATTEGFLLFNSNFSSPSNLRFQYYHKNQEIDNSLGANDIHCITEDTEGNIWMGTFGGGLNLVKQSNKGFEFETINRAKGLPNNVVYTITDDKQGYLWLSTENSIVKIEKKNKGIEVFGKGNEIENVEFSEATSCMLQNGDICVGSKSGFYIFKPDIVHRKVLQAPLVFTGLSLFNKKVEIGGEESVLEAHIDQTEKITFNHKQNVFSIEFATLDMRAPEKIKYAYKLDGFDKDWNNVESKNFATYTALPPGEYTFRVKSTDSEGIWLNNERQIKIEVLPSFWQSGFAKFLYLLLIIGIFMGILYIFITIIKLKHNVLLEQQMTDMKLRFFTDISHELRTPLTLISLPVDNILKNELEPVVHEQLMLVRRNLDRVMKLINQILDFRKLQNNKMRLSIEEIAFGDFVQKSASNFIEIANAKNINFKIEDNTREVKVWADAEKLESIIYNLLSNAFKFTTSGKRIIVKTTISQDKALLSVTDEGIGIAQEKINFIFDRFFSTSALQTIAQKSTGIGLDLVKKLVDLHHGTIRVESQLGRGSTFEVELKLGIEHFGDEADIILSDQKVPQPEEVQEEIAVIREEETPLILIVEDNEELRHFLKTSLKHNYRVEEAENGQQGWEKVEQLMPDFIITDLKMPEMDGMELTKLVKEDNRTSHIPVILLSAVTDMENKVEGFKAGADDYITKPFNSAFLHARIENLIKQRRVLQQLYRSKLATANKSDFSLPPIEVQSKDELFMKQLIKLMDEHLDNFDLNIDFMASELGMSRTVLFNKLKSLTGYSPVEFVREIRLERAGEYMRNSQLSVSEISYRVGIEDPRYFSRCFKQKFGATPSDYRSQHHFSQNI